MASSTAHSLLSANSCAFPSHGITKNLQKMRKNSAFFSVRASSESEPDCNVDECAPDKEVGKVSMEWLAGEKTKVTGTYPPRKKGWTGYVEKDTAGQTNIYSIEPTVYVADSAISSGNAGTSAEGADNIAAIAALLGLVSIAAASSVLLQVGKTPAQVQTLEYYGPSLSYYINKFKSPETVQASVPNEPENSPTVSVEDVSPEISQFPVESNIEPTITSSSLSNLS